MVFLLDTSVVVACYKPGDPLHSSAVSLLRRGEMGFAVSPVGLFELYSVISRLRSFIVVPDKFRGVSTDVLVRFIVRDLGLKLLASTLLVRHSGFKCRIPLEYYLSTVYSSRLRLRALDLLHIAYASILRDRVDAFITGDPEILEARDLIMREAGVRVKSPEEVLKGT